MILKREREWLSISHLSTKKGVSGSLWDPHIELFTILWEIDKYWRLNPGYHTCLLPQTYLFSHVALISVWSHTQGCQRVAPDGAEVGSLSHWIEHRPRTQEECTQSIEPSPWIWVTFNKNHRSFWTTAMHQVLCHVWPILLSLPFHRVLTFCPSLQVDKLRVGNANWPCVQCLQPSLSVIEGVVGGWHRELVPS